LDTLVVDCESDEDNIRRMISQALSMVLALIVVRAPVPPAQSPGVDELIQAVSRNVKEFQDQLPDFVCTEKINSATYRSGSVRKQRTVESIFTAVQKPSRGGGVQNRAAFMESREVTAVDGKAVRKGTRMPHLPVLFAGGFSSVLTMTFSPENLEFHRYTLDTQADRPGPQLVRFVTREDQKRLRTYFNGEILVDRDAGKALIDTSSMQVIRLEREFLNLPRRLTHLTNIIDYAPVNIGGREFWLPRTIRTDGTQRDSRDTETYIAVYSNCKRFVADIRILP
jgi:hypothetical protein